MFVPTPSYASPAAMELALRITNVIREFQQGRSDVTSRDIRMALRMAEHSTGTVPLHRAILTMIAGLVAAGLAISIFASKNPGNAGPSSTTFPFIIISIAIGVLLMLVLLRRR